MSVGLLFYGALSDERMGLVRVLYLAQLSVTYLALHFECELFNISVLSSTDRRPLFGRQIIYDNSLR
jgi:hypothetical protein